MFENKLFLGIDGGQSHTEAVIADEFGNILGIGLGGAINHGHLPDAPDKLKEAINVSVGEALKKAGLPDIEKVNFASVHCGLTGGADFKEEIVNQLIKTDILGVGDDALIALLGATGGKAGIVVMAGTGSMVFGINEPGETARAAGLGYMFSDEGSGFWLAVETIKLAIKEQDRIIAENGLQDLVLDFFKVGKIRQLTNAFYNQQISRDRIAIFAKTVSDEAERGNERLKSLIEHGAGFLVENVKGVANSLGFIDNFTVSAVGGMFRGKLLKSLFLEILNREVPKSKFTEPEFPPPIGALLVAYQQADIEINELILLNLKTSYEK